MTSVFQPRVDAVMGSPAARLPVHRYFPCSHFHKRFTGLGYIQDDSLTAFLSKNVKLKQETCQGCRILKTQVRGCMVNKNEGVPKISGLQVSIQQVLEARVIFCAAPALGHNQETHPECSARVPAILEALQKAHLTPEFRGKDVLKIETFGSANFDDVSAVHTKNYIVGLERAMQQAGEEGLIFIDSSGPTYATPSTYAESLRAAGAGIALVDAVVTASRMNKMPPMGFALIRPPGHHAIPAGPMGFCVFGNIAVAARYAQRKLGLQKVFIIDFDVHHGNGTNDAFYEDPNIYFLSIHQAGSYPGTGKFEDIGKGAGEGSTLNLPLPGGSGDEAMAAVFNEVIVPAAQRFKPDLLLVSAGYDGHVLDPLAGLQYTTGTYYRLAANIRELASEVCGGRCVFFLEGGYNLKSLSDSVSESFRAFLGERSTADRIDNPAILYDEPSLLIRKAIDQVKSIHIKVYFCNLPHPSNGNLPCKEKAK